MRPWPLLLLAGCAGPDLPAELQPTEAALAERCAAAIRRQAAPAPVTVMPSRAISLVQVELMVSIDYPNENRTARIVCTAQAGGLGLSEARP